MTSTEGGGLAIQGDALSLSTPELIGGREWSRIWRKLREHRLALFGMFTLLVLALAAAFAPLLTPFDPYKTALTDRLLAPNSRHWMGTDELGRDIFSRILFGGRISLGVGILVALLSAAIGSIIGAVSAYLGGLFDEVAMRVVDMVRALPALPFLIVFTVVLREMGLVGGFWSIVVVLVIFIWTDTARIVRGVVLSLKELDFVMAARSVGIPGWRIVLRHLLPNAVAPIIVSITLTAGVAILIESSLSFLGLGIQPPTPSWGNMLFNAQTYLWTNPLIAVFPGAFIFITLLSLNFLGDGIRDALDPRLSAKHR